MEKTKLIVMLKSLSKAEVKEFGNFLMGVPYQKTGSVFKLYTHLKLEYPEFALKKINKEYVIKKLFKEVKNTDKRLYDTIYHLSNALEDFLIKKRLDNDAVTKNFLRLEMLKERKLDDLFFQKINAIEKEWETQQIAGIEGFHNWYQLKKMHLWHPNQEVHNETPMDLIHWLDKYYISIKLYWTLCYKINSNLVSNNKQELPQYFIDEIMKNSTLEDFNNVPQIRILSKLINAINNDNYDDYLEIKDDFFHYFDSKLFNKSEEADLYSAFNYCCFYNWKRGKPNALQNLFELNKFAVEKQLILEDNYIAAESFRNIVTAACLVNEIDWAVAFIQDYGKYIKEEFREDTILICEAKIAMTQNSYELALTKLIPITKFKNVFFRIYGTSLELQCYFELEGYDEVFFNLAQSFNQYLNRKENISHKVITDFKNFIYYIKILKKESNNKKSLENLLEEISQKHNIANKEWLVSKLKIFTQL